MIQQKIRELAEQKPDNTAIIYEDYRISYFQLNQMLDKLANGLKNVGIEKGDRVALILPNVPHFIFNYYAIQRLGATVVPVNYMLPPDELLHVLNNSKPKAVIYWDGFRGEMVEFFKSYNDPLIKIVLGTKREFDFEDVTTLLANSSDEKLEIENNGEVPAVIQYTAGNDNLPIGAEISYESVMQNSNSVAELFGFSDSDVFAVILPLFMIVNQTAILNNAFSLGCPVVLHSKVDVELIAKSIDNLNVTVIVSSAKFFKSLCALDAEKIKGNSLKNCLSVHSVIPHQLFTDFKEKFGISLINAYSVTEAGGIVAATHPSYDESSQSIGMPLSEMEIQIHNNHGEAVNVGDVGEIALKGKSLLQRYWANDDLTDQRLNNGWFYPGDIGKKNSDGFITLIEKKSNVIFKSGFQIPAGEIEQVMLEHPKIREVAVISVPHPDHKEDIMAYVVPVKDETLEKQEIIEFCKEQFPVYKCPQSIEFCDELPKSRMGKILKRKLKSSDNK
ncbi:hypothetical protein B6I21_03515 [candidate division KSB1 bacterium 4572_119]|nr:MAG: hypothetical protein B6I21_03515 [candidate division KSB1 bacterium 4572_119]